MSAQALDWVVVGLAVAGAAAWLALRVRRNLRQKRRKAGACGSPCEGCPFGKDCGGEGFSIAWKNDGRRLSEPGAKKRTGLLDRSAVVLEACLRV